MTTATDNEVYKMDHDSGLLVPLGYNAVVDNGRRQAPRAGAIVAESKVLNKGKRRKLQATAQDQNRNHSLVAWMVRRHLDYVARFKFSFECKHEGLKNQVRRLFRWHAQPRNFDIARRIGREQAFRLLESEKTLSGDAAMLKLSTKNLQMIESDLIAYPKMGAWGKGGRSAPLAKSVSEQVGKDTGCVLNRAAGVDKYCICNRGPKGNGLHFDHLEPWQNVIFSAVYTRFASQTRGISPFSTALNSVQDLYEGFEWNQLKMKIHGLFGIAVMRDYVESELSTAQGFGVDGVPDQVTGAATAEAAEESSAATVTAAIEKLDPDTMIMADLGKGERIETIESKSPSTEFVNGSYMYIHIILLALDIPLSAFDSRKSSFAALLADAALYEKSCRSKRESNLYARQEYAEWVIDWAWDDPNWNLRKLAVAAEMSKQEVKEACEWIPDGVPWLQKLSEVKGDTMAISAGLDNPIDTTRRRGGCVFKNIDKIAEVQKYAKKKGVVMSFGDPGTRTVGEAAADEKAADNDAGGKGGSKSEE